MQPQLLVNLITDLEAELVRLGYTPATIRTYRYQWKKILDFAQLRGKLYFSEQLGIDFAKEVWGIPQDDFARVLPQKETQQLRILRMLGDFQLHHCVLRRYFKHRKILTDPYFQEVSSQFKAHCETHNYSPVTTNRYVKQSAHFMDFLAAQSMKNFDGLDMVRINDYIKTLANYGYKTVEQNLCSLRAFFRFLFEKEIIGVDYSTKIPMIRARKDTSIPSVWSQDDLKKLLGAVDRKNPKGKRDYAILLLACRLGLRCSDIKKLRITDFDWKNKKLTFVQSKTRQPLELPLVPDVGWAVIEYLKNGRPKVDSPYLFVRHLAPFLPFSDDDHLNQLIRDYMTKGHICSFKHRRGMHSLRHTMASVLLEKGTPLAVISDVLGHVDTNSTAVYLKVDLHQLAECPLDFEELIRHD